MEGNGHDFDMDRTVVNYASNVHANKSKYIHTYKTNSKMALTEQTLGH